MSSRLEVAVQPEPRPVDPTPKAPSNIGFRPEIQGLRAVAVLLVAVYHIWLGRVSGGVDVFLMLTGFLLTASLLRSVDRKGKVQFLSFWARLARRLFPLAALSLLGILVVTWLFLPQARWHDIIAEVIASALYYENWQLAFNSVDYLAQGNALSPVQHFWSLSIQGQFYLILPVLVAIAVLWRARTRVVLFGLLSAMFVLSIAYSIYQTSNDQPWAYFDTGARLWEFALGGMFAIVLPRLRLPRGLRFGLGWFGLAALISCGLLLQVSTSFPGFVALWPVGAALLIIVAGSTGSRFGADRLLSSRVFDYFGNISYALYLWHWPVLVCYLEVQRQDTVGLRGGFIVLGVSILLADVTTRLVERGLKGFKETVRTSLLIGLPCLLIVAGAGVGWSAYLDHRANVLADQAKDLRSYPGAAALHGEWDLPAVPMVPMPADAKWDLPAIVDDGCQQKKTEPEVLVCTYGAENGSKTVVLAGSSLAAHWFPALEARAKANDWRLVTVVKSGCPLSVGGAPDTGAAESSCPVWQPAAVQKIIDLRPDLVVTPGSRTTSYGEQLPRGYVDVWRQLADAGVPLLGLRDVPRARVVASECIEKHGAALCDTEASLSQDDVPPYDANPNVPPSMRFADLTPHVCRADGWCPVVIGNVLVYRDKSHLTATYARTLGPMLEREVQSALR